MSTRDFNGIPSLQEVECSGQNLSQNVERLISISLFSVLTDKMFVYLDAYDKSCKTFENYSSCDVHDSDTKLSSVKTLITDLIAGENMEIGCNVSTFEGMRHYKKYSWSVLVVRTSKTEL